MLFFLIRMKFLRIFFNKNDVYKNIEAQNPLDLRMIRERMIRERGSRFIKRLELFSGVAPRIFRQGADSSDEGAKV